MGAAEAWHTYFDRPVPNIVLRIAVMFLGVSLVAFGIALSRATDMGTSVISCIPAVLSFAFPAVTMGTFTFAFNALLLALQVAVLRRRFKPLQLLCLPFVFVFSAIIDVFVPLCAAIPMPVYPVRVLFCLVSCVFIAAGVWLQVKARLVMLPGDGFVLALSTATGQPFPRLKVATDCTYIVVGAVLSLALMGGLFGVREGTVLAAVLVGPIIKLFDRALGKGIEFVVPTAGHPTLTAER